MDKKPFTFDDLWYWYLTGEQRIPFPKEIQRALARQQRIHGLLPGSPRCIECDVPLSGLGSLIFRPGSRPSSFSPRICSGCESTARKEEGGAEVVLSMLFADVRGSTPLAEATPTSEFKELIQKFYKVTSGILIEHNAMVNRLMGDQVSALFVPRFAGKDHAKVAIRAAQLLLRATGHEDPNGPWIPVGVGVHTGAAYVGVIGSKDGVNEIAVLGSAANLTARLSSQAAAGEVLVSEEAADSAGLNKDKFEGRILELKGISQPVQARVIQARPAR